MQVIYVSQPFGYDVPMLSGILLDARNNNIRDGITGALMCRNDIYLQLLEGPEAEVNAAVARIARDDRHVNMQTLVSEKVESRIFSDWAMLHDPAKSLIWSEKEIAGGILERASTADIRQMFKDLADHVAENGPPV